VIQVVILRDRVRAGHHPHGVMLAFEMCEVIEAGTWRMSHHEPGSEMNDIDRDTFPLLYEGPLRRKQFTGQITDRRLSPADAGIGKGAPSSHLMDPVLPGRGLPFVHALLPTAARFHCCCILKHIRLR